MKRINNTYKMIFFLTLFSFCGSSFAQTIFITKLSDLEFGDVFIGTANVDVPYTDARAAKFSFYYQNGAGKKEKGGDMNVTFTLPANLVFSGNNLPITFDQAHSAWDDQDVVGAAQTFDPYAGFQTKKAKENEVHYVWLGANIASTTGYPSGLYEGTITMIVEFK